MLAYNATVHGATRVSPFYAMFNRTPMIPSDLMINLPEEKEQAPMTVKTFVSKRKHQLKGAFRFYAETIIIINISLFAHIEQISIEQLNYYIHNIYNNK